MKKILLSLIVPFLAHANVNVGDWVEYSMRIESGGSTFQGSMRSEIMEYNSTTNQYLEKQLVTVDGNGTNENDKWTDADQYMSKEDVDQILSECESIGGTKENIQVPGGVFDTCYAKTVTNEGESEAWIGRTPMFRAPKIISYDKTNDVKVYLEIVKSSTY